MEYTAQSIKRKHGVSHVRIRPSMYIGNTGTSGMHHCVKEGIDNVVDEMVSGNATTLTLILHLDGSCSILDDGRGIPVEDVSDEGVMRPAIELAVGELNSGGKFDDDSYKTSAGLHGVGIKATNATSEFFTVTVKRGGFEWVIGYTRGVKTQNLTKIGDTTETGTCIRFKPDSDIFQHTKYNKKILKDFLIELSYLVKGKKFVFIDEETGKTETFKSKTGLNGLLLAKLNDKKLLHEPIYIEKENKIDKLMVECSFAYTDADDSVNIYSFVNNVPMNYGGTHVDGFKTAIWNILKTEILSSPQLKSIKEQPKRNDALDGLLAILSVKLDNPQFEGQTKGALGNDEVRETIQPIITETFQEFLDSNPKVKKEIIEKAIMTIIARDAAKNAKAHARRKSVFKNSTLPGKLADCQIKEMEGTEIFIVEGDSAAGSAKQAREAKNQAVLPLRGKILNIEKQENITTLLKNEQIGILMDALGLVYQETPNDSERPYFFDFSNLRYERIIMMTDADVDGSHIRTLLETFFFKCTPELIRNGHLFAAVPPLYRVIYNKTDKYITDEVALKEYMRDKDESKASIFRFKGLGEMKPEQLRDTVMSPKNRKLIKIVLNDEDFAEEIIGILMGKEVEPRREFIEHHALEANLDI